MALRAGEGGFLDGLIFGSVDGEGGLNLSRFPIFITGKSIPNGPSLHNGPIISADLLISENSRPYLHSLGRGRRAKLKSENKFPPPEGVWTGDMGDKHLKFAIDSKETSPLPFSISRWPAGLSREGH
jgi:hypothetical protein